MAVQRKSGSSNAEEAYLVVDDDVRFAGSMRRLLAPHGDVTVTHCVRDAVSAKPPRGVWTAAFLDFDLPDGTAFTVLEAFEGRAEMVPAMIITGHLANSLANRAFELGARVLSKPIASEHIRLFLESVRGEVAVRRVVDHWRIRYGLTTAETAVLRDGVEGVERGTLAERRGVSETTLRTHVRHMLQKTGDASMSDAIQRALREVIVGRS
jgi:DNA-binding NarL/FixJ family response regulator